MINFIIVAFAGLHVTQLIQGFLKVDLMKHIETVDMPRSLFKVLEVEDEDRALSTQEVLSD